MKRRKPRQTDGPDLDALALELHEMALELRPLLTDAEALRSKAIRTRRKRLKALADDRLEKIARTSRNIERAEQIISDMREARQRRQFNKAAARQGLHLAIATWVLAVATVGLIIATIWG